MLLRKEKKSQRMGKRICQITTLGNRNVLDFILQYELHCYIFVKRKNI